MTWQTLHQPVRTFQSKWTLLDISPSPEEDNANYCKHTKKDSSVSGSPLTLFPFIANLDFGAILVKPSVSPGDARFPLVVFIHGLRTLAVCADTRELLN